MPAQSCCSPTTPTHPDANLDHAHWPRQHLLQNLVAFQRVQALAEKKGVTPGQLALAWVHNQGPDVLPIPGTKRLR